MKHLLRRRPSAALIVACLALFAALGPVAYGSHLGSLLIGHPNTAGNNSTSLQGNHAGKLLQLTNNSTAAGSTALGLTVGAGRTPFTVNSSTKVANLNADKLDGLDSSALSATGRKITGSCNPTSSAIVDCGTLTINLPRPGLRVLIVASATWYSNENLGASAGQGTCRIGVNGAPFGPNAFPGEITDNSGTQAEQSLTLTNVTDPNLGAGNHTFGLACNQRYSDQDIVFNSTYVSVVVLGPG